tara:strand:+ start:555 stop:722 length:168 start_codon:yes stop_codon:yes gene_type:complete
VVEVVEKITLLRVKMEDLVVVEVVNPQLVDHLDLEVQVILRLQVQRKELMVEADQ